MTAYLAGQGQFAYDTGTSYAFSATVQPGDVLVMQAAVYRVGPSGAHSYSLTGTWDGPVTRDDLFFDMLTRTRYCTETGTVSYTLSRPSTQGAVIQVWVVRGFPSGGSWRSAGISGNFTGLRGANITSGSVPDPSLRLTFSAGYNIPDTGGTRAPANTSGATPSGLTTYGSGFIQVDLEATYEYVAGADQVDATAAATGPEWPNAHTINNGYIGHTLIVPDATLSAPICGFADTYTRTGSGGLGTTDDGYSYTLMNASPAPTTYSTTGSVGRLSRTSSGTPLFTGARLQPLITASASAHIRFRWPAAPSTSSTPLFALFQRFQGSSGRAYALVSEKRNDGRFYTRLTLLLNGLSGINSYYALMSSGSEAVSAFTAAAGEWYHLRMQPITAAGGASVTLYGKFWREIDGEPPGWQLTISDPLTHGFTDVLEPGRAGFYTSPPISGYTPPWIVEIDDFHIDCAVTARRRFGQVF